MCCKLPRSIIQSETSDLKSKIHFSSRFGTISRRSSKSSASNIKVPVPGDVTFISYKTSLQDYCQKVGWLAPAYNTTQASAAGYDSKVSFGGLSYSSGVELGTSKQDAEQRAAHAALIGLNVLNASNKFAADGLLIYSLSLV